MQGYLKIFVLKELVKKEKTGYDLMKSFEQFTGNKMPSPGTIYPLLNDLLKKKMVTFSVKDNRKIYRISENGERILKSLMAERKKTLEKIISVMSPIYDKKELARIKISLNVMSGGKKHFARDFDVLNEMRESIFDFVMSKEYRKKRAGFRKILHETSERIKKLN